MMKVRYIGETSATGFENGAVYDVLSVERGWYRIIDPFEKEDYIYPPEMFEEIN